jgi:Txe/YoeB family toxin of Txe-Axe toxin-antitoxin module
MSDRYAIRYSSSARKDFKKLIKSKYGEDVLKLIGLVSCDPYKNPPPFKYLTGEWAGYISRRYGRR